MNKFNLVYIEGILRDFYYFNDFYDFQKFQTTL